MRYSGYFSLLLAIGLLLAACTPQPQPVPTTPLAQAAAPPTRAATPVLTPTAAPSIPTPTSGAATATPAIAAGPPINRGLPTATPGSGGVVPTATPIPGAAAYHGDARFAYTDNGNIFSFESSTGQVRQLTKVESGDWATDPAWSPDGKSIVYSLQIAPRNGNPAYADLMIMNPDGSNKRVLIAHDAPGAILERPIWSSDGKTLYMAYSRPIYENGRYKDVVQEIDSIPVTGGSRKTLVDGAIYPSIDKDGKHMTYFDNVAGDLWIADLSDPKNTARTLLRQDDYAILYAPRLSPDGTKIVFISAGKGTMQGASLPYRSAGKLDMPLQHGIPVDLWIADVATGDTKEITKYLLDSPFPTWSADGKQLAFISANGLYILNPDGAGLSIVSPMSLHGEIDWAP